MEDKKKGWHKYDMDMSELTAYENLSNAVIEQAVADMADAILKVEMARRQERKYEKMFLETDRFFRSDMIRNMTDVDPKLLRQLHDMETRQGMLQMQVGQEQKVYPRQGRRSELVRMEPGRSHLLQTASRREQTGL